MNSFIQDSLHMYYTFQSSVFLEMNRHLRYKNKHDKMKEIKTKQKLIYQLWTLQSKKKSAQVQAQETDTLSFSQSGSSERMLNL